MQMAVGFLVAKILNFTFYLAIVRIKTWQFHGGIYKEAENTIALLSDPLKIYTGHGIGMVFL